MSPTTHLIALYDPGDLVNLVNVTKILSFNKVLPIMLLCKFGQNMAIGSEDSVQTRLFHSFMTLVTLNIRSRSPKSNNFLMSSQ